MTPSFGDDSSGLYSGYSSYNNWAASACKASSVASNFAKSFAWGLNAVNASSVAPHSNLGSAMNPGASCFNMPASCSANSIISPTHPGIIGTSTSLLGGGDINSSPYNCLQSYGSSTNAITYPYSMYTPSTGNVEGIVGASDSLCSDPPSPRMKPNPCSISNKQDECDEDSVNHPDSSNSAANDRDYKQS
jgi:hypothetical protein